MWSFTVTFGFICWEAYPFLREEPNHLHLPVNPSVDLQTLALALNYHIALLSLYYYNTQSMILKQSSRVGSLFLSSEVAKPSSPHCQSKHQSTDSDRLSQKRAILQKNKRILGMYCFMLTSYLSEFLCCRRLRIVDILWRACLASNLNCFIYSVFLSWERSYFVKVNFSHCWNEEWWLKWSCS